MRVTAGVAIIAAATALGRSLSPTFDPVSQQISEGEFVLTRLRAKTRQILHKIPRSFPQDLC
jgi:hypothetical protein